jgi:dTDP-4-dehydrorhamnose reductase
MKIFISGASGLVGGNCFSYFTQQGATVLGTYFSFALPQFQFYNTLNIADPNNADIVAFAPDVIVHCGAMTHVDACETEVDESYNKTVVSTKKLIALAEQLNARLVYIGTDYVFDGKQGPYYEHDTLNPLSVYAKHKLEAEQLVSQHSSKHLILRITNVYGNEVRNKNFIARIIEQCNRNQKLTLTLPNDQYATPVNAYDVARAMWVLLNDNHSGVFHIASTDFMNRVDLALTVLKYYPHAEYDLIPKTTAELNQPALRPLMGGLHKVKFQQLYPTFRFTTVDEYIANQI